MTARPGDPPTMSAADEEQRATPLGFVRSALACAWLEYRGLRRNPASLYLTALQAWTVVGVWYFVSTFLSPVADPVVRTAGGSYVAYVLVGVLLNQSALAALLSPFTTVSEAFWDKRLETYRLASQGIWANLIGRLGWKVSFSAVLQVAAAAVLVATGALRLAPGLPWLWVLLVWLLLLASNAGLGLMGASLFFLLEVKSGQDPITWIYQYLIQIVTGLYIPLAVLPGWLRGVGAVLPQTYAFGAVRTLVLTTRGFDGVTGDLAGLGVGTLLTVALGIWMVNVALRRAERQAGLGVVV